MEYKDLKALMLAAVKAEKNAPVAFSYTGENGVENYSAAELNGVIRSELNELTKDFIAFEQNKGVVFRLIQETIDDVLPAKVEKQYEMFAEFKNIPQGDKAVFTQKITEASKRRAKTFVTKAALAGRYETFKLDGRQLTVETTAMGVAARIELEEYLDGRYQLSDFVDLAMEGMDEFILREIIKALDAACANLPATNKVEFAGFDEDLMDELLSISDSYGKSAIFCTREFAAKMIPDTGWVSNGMKDRMWSEGYLGDYKGHSVILLEQSLVDETNTTKVIDPSMAYIIPSGPDSKPVKIVFEGATQVRTVDNNDDWSTDMQFYKKYGVAVFENYWMSCYKNTNLTTKVRPGLKD